MEYSHNHLRFIGQFESLLLPELVKVGQIHLMEPRTCFVDDLYRFWLLRQTKKLEILLLRLSIFIAKQLNSFLLFTADELAELVG